MKKLKKEGLCSVLFRIGLGGVFLYFGVDKFFHTLSWTKWIPDWLYSLLPYEPFNVVYGFGVFEILLGVLILIGLYTRVAASIAAVFLFTTIVSFGLNEIMIRDVGLLFLALGLAVVGPGCYSIDKALAKKSKV